MTYKIGEILTSDCDVEVERAISGEKVVIPKGNKIIIGADKFAHHIRNGMIQPLPEDAEVKGYDAAGIAEYVYIYARNHFAIDEMLEYYEETPADFIREIEFALDEIGF